MSRFFWLNVDKSADCWVWTASRAADGYGDFRLGYRRYIATRALWTHLHGPIPAGHDICHQCDNPSCVRPDHLFAGSRLQNVQDARKKGRLNRGGGLPHGTTAALSMAGERNPRAKLKWAQVQEIRERYELGTISQDDLAREFGVCRASIGYIVNRETWR